MSFISFDIETRTSVDPWTQAAKTTEVRTGWACTCGATMARKLKRGQTVTTSAGAHLTAKHNAPYGSSFGCDECGYETPDTVRTTADRIQGHAARHEQWVIEVWDA